MPKSQKKNTALNEKSQATSKSDKACKNSVKKPNTLAHSKATKKVAKTLTKSASGSKQAKVVTLLKRPAGATIDEMAKFTGWQRHSVQGMMSGVLKKRLGLTIISNKEERGRIYRIPGSTDRL